MAGQKLVDQRPRVPQVRVVVGRDRKDAAVQLVGGGAAQHRETQGDEPAADRRGGRKPPGPPSIPLPSGLLAGGAVQELILATNPTVEGEATAHFLSELARARGVRATRIAHGVPIGGELEYIDGGTLAHALAGRHSL